MSANGSPQPTVQPSPMPMTWRVQRCRLTAADGAQSDGVVLSISTPNGSHVTFWSLADAGALRDALSRHASGIEVARSVPGSAAVSDGG